MPDAPTLVDVARLVAIMATLRGPDGCPWDAEQTTESLKPYLVEEAYEVLEALDSGDADHIREELGDLLLQIVFHARIFEERGLFDFNGVAAGIADKLVRRHPHVFAAAEITDREDLDRQWQRIKAEENQGRKARPASPLSPSHLPALARAARMQSRWQGGENTSGAGDDLVSRAQAGLSRLTQAGGPSESREILGSILFDLVALGRSMGHDAEETLRRYVNQLDKQKRD